MVFTASIISAVLHSFIIVFQIGLVVGRPWGHLAWGGQHPGKLPRRFRIASCVSILILFIFASVNLHTSGLLDLHGISFPVNLFQWIISVYAVLGTLMNGISRSKPERYLWTPVAFTLAVMNILILLYYDFQ